MAEHDDADAIRRRLMAMEADVIERERAAEARRRQLLAEVEENASEARSARLQYEDARRKSLGEIERPTLEEPLNAPYTPPPSQVESWTQSSWFKLVVVLFVAGVVIAVVALAWVAPALHRAKNSCSKDLAAKLLSDVAAATPQKGSNRVVRFYHQDLCFDNTTVVEIPGGVTVNISASPPVTFTHFRFRLKPSATLYLRNITLLGANWSAGAFGGEYPSDEGGAAVAVIGSALTPAPPPPPPPHPLLAAAGSGGAGVGGRRVRARQNTTFVCVACNFTKNTLWARHGTLYHPPPLPPFAPPSTADRHG